jgi:hypothetical protein
MADNQPSSPQKPITSQAPPRHEQNSATARPAARPPVPKK